MNNWIKELVQLGRFDITKYLLDIFYLIISGFFSNFVIFYCLIPLKNNLILNGIFSKNIDTFPLAISTIEIPSWIVTYLILRKIHEVLRTHLLQLRITIVKNEYKLNLNNIGDEWDIQGNIVPSKDGLYVTNTHAGSLIKNDYLDRKIWKDFVGNLDIDFKSRMSTTNIYPNNTKRRKKYKWLIINQEFRQLLGIVFRAQSLDDYFMLEIWKLDNEIVFRPHVRIYGSWDAPYYNAPVNIFHLNGLNPILKFKIIVKENRARVFIKEKGMSWQFCVDWELPSLYEINLENKLPNGNFESAVRKVYFKSKPGMFGFRNTGNELAIVKSLEIDGKFSDNDNKLFDSVDKDL